LPLECPLNCHNAVIKNSSAHQLCSVGRAAILSNNDVSFSCEMALAMLRLFQMYVHYVVFHMNFNIIAHFQLKIWSNKIIQ
jgi:hypothetical protein